MLVDNGRFFSPQDMQFLARLRAKNHD